MNPAGGRALEPWKRAQQPLCARQTVTPLMGVCPEKANLLRCMHPSVCCSTIYNSQDVEATRGMNKEDGVYIYNGILLRHLKKWNNAICSNINGPRDYPTKWNKSDKAKYQMMSTIHEVFKKKKGYKWIYKTETVPQTLKTNMANKRGESRKGINWDFWINIYTPLYKNK